MYSYPNVTKAYSFNYISEMFRYSPLKQKHVTFHFLILLILNGAATLLRSHLCKWGKSFQFIKEALIRPISGALLKTVLSDTKKTRKVNGKTKR